MHKFARGASLAALAAAEQDKYNDISKLLFKNYRKLDGESIRGYAEAAGLDMQKFDKDYKDPSLNRLINQDMALGRRVKVRGVPALFINGRLAKKRSLKDLTHMIEEALQREK